jgi:hypothetical protein
MLDMRAPFDRVARIAERQHGRVSHAQLVAAGVDRNRVARWLRDGRLLRVHAHVYAVGHAAPSLRADYAAAVLAGGPGAVLSHRSAAHLLDLVQGGAGLPEITVPRTSGHKRPGIVIHRVPVLPARDVCEVDAIAVTIVPRTLLDLAPLLEPAALARACHQAWVRHRTALPLVEACIARNPRRQGAAKLRRALGADVTLSVLEDAFLRLLRKHRLPRPRTNIDHNGDKVDCHWPQLGVTIELVSYRYHGSRVAFEEDVARRRRSQHIAFSYGDVQERPTRTAAEVAALLRAGTRR